MFWIASSRSGPPTNSTPQARRIGLSAKVSAAFQEPEYCGRHAWRGQIELPSCRSTVARI
jgi:hypothetical protein